MIFRPLSGRTFTPCARSFFWIGDFCSGSSPGRHPFPTSSKVGSFFRFSLKPGLLFRHLIGVPSLPRPLPAGVFSVFFAAGFPNQRPAQPEEPALFRSRKNRPRPSVSSVCTDRFGLHGRGSVRAFRPMPKPPASSRPGGLVFDVGPQPPAVRSGALSGAIVPLSSR